MDITILLIALGLAMDSFSVAITQGLTHSPYTIMNALKIATYFGLSHVLMPAVGWLAGNHLITFISGLTAGTSAVKSSSTRLRISSSVTKLISRSS